MRSLILSLVMFSSLTSPCRAADPSLAEQAPNTWVKRSPSGRMAPPIGYESAFAWDSTNQKLIRMCPHAIDGHEQLGEVWTFEPKAGKWDLMQPNTSPPGACRIGQHVFDTLHNKYLRFPGTSGDHGWQWHRELYLNECSVWAYDLKANKWKAMRPMPEPFIYRQHFASWDGKYGKALVMGGASSGKGPAVINVYDPHTNTWEFKKGTDQPGNRLGGTMAWCPSNGLHYIFGAENQDKSFLSYSLEKNEFKPVNPPSLPPTNGNEAVMAWDTLNDVLLCVVIVREGEQERAAAYSSKRHLETWAYSPKTNAWKRMNPNREPDPGGLRCRMLTYAPELNLFFFDVREQKPSGTAAGGGPQTQVWSYRYAASSKAPPPPPAARPEPGLAEDVVASVISAKEVRLTWKPPAGTAVKHYIVERAPVEVFSEAEMPFTSGACPPPAEGPGVAAVKAIGEFQVLDGNLAAATYTDKSIDLSKKSAITGKKLYEFADKKGAGKKKGGKISPYRFGVYAYRVRVVNQAGQTSGPSPYVLTIPAAPQQVFSHEGGGCTVKWAASPEANLTGYRVYRQDSMKETIKRLTPKAIKETQFTDRNVGGQARYYIFAVDALGQEGYPSSPVWCNRRLKDRYAPFVGEWHQ